MLTVRRAVRPLVAFALAAVAATFIGGASQAVADQVPIPSSPTRWVTDTAGLLSAQTRDSLDARLQAYEKETGHQIIVWIGTTTGDTQLEDWTIHAFTAWKVGRKGLDDGLALFLFTQDHKARIEVGYGLEPVMTDARASRIIRDDIVPNMRQGDGDAAVTSAIDAILATIGGEHGATANPNAAAAEPASSFNPVDLIALVFLVLFVFMLVAAIARAARGGRYYTIGSGPIWWGGGSSGGGWGGFGGGGGGFGGFSGGGGGGGGGGASGGW
jgi:uncharacterized protein